MKLDSVSGSAPTYSASWMALREVSGDPHLCFGQKVGGVIGSRVDVRVGEENLFQIIENSQDFIERLFESVEPAEHADWSVEEEWPTNVDKYILEDANMIGLAYSGTLAELEFFAVPARDILAVQSNRPGTRYRGPRPVLSVMVTVGQLRWLLEEVIRHVTRHRESS